MSLKTFLHSGYAALFTDFPLVLISSHRFALSVIIVALAYLVLI